MDISPTQNLRTNLPSPVRALRKSQAVSAEHELPKDHFQANPKVEVLGGNEVSAQSLQALTSTLDKATEYFRENFGPVHQGLKVDLSGDGGALRTGFNFEENAIRFPSSPKIHNRGLNSKDVIIHEAFHALVFQAYPEACSETSMRSKDSVRIHEGLADYFAYQMNPDQHFGENYSKVKPHLRSYKTHRRISLSPGTHSQGNAITSYLIKNRVQPSDVRSFLESGDFSLEGLKNISPGMKADLELDEKFAILSKIPNYPESSISRYRLVEGRPLKVSFEANETLEAAHPAWQIRWVNPNGSPSKDFQFESTNSRDFQVSAKGTDGSEKVVALFVDDQEIIGSRPFYLSQRAPKDPASSPSTPKPQ